MGRAPVVSLDFFGLEKAIGWGDNKTAVNDDLSGLAEQTSSLTHTRKDFWPPPTVDALGSTALSMTFQGCRTQRGVAGSDNQHSLFPPKGISGPSAAVKSDELRDDQASGKSSASSERSPLNKPLEDLTEEDIKQLTREDCRRYLKEKGMRRPSWNKSQVIQQVLSLKGLIDSNKANEEKSRGHAHGASVEATPAESFCMQQTLPTQPQQRAAANKLQTLSSIQRVFPSDNMNSVFAEKLLEPYTNCSWITGRQGCSDGRFSKPNQSCQSSQLVAGTEGVAAMEFQLIRHGSTLPSLTRPSRSLPACAFSADSGIPMVNQQQIKWGSSFQGATQEVSTLGTCIPNTVEKLPNAQLTIFYSGMVNVYDDVPADKAQAIMLLAGRDSSLSLSFSPFIPSIAANTSFGTATSTPDNYLTALPAVSTSFSGILPGTEQQTRTAMQSEAQPSRKACLQRFLEKRKDRFHSKSTPYTSSKKALYGVPSIKIFERTTSLPTVPQLLPPLVPRQRPTQSSGSETSSHTKPPETPRQASSDDQGTSVENRTSDS